MRITCVVQLSNLACRATVYHHNTQQIETVEVADPYSRGLAADGARSMFVDLENDVQLMPEGWQGHQVPELAGALLPHKIDALQPIA